MGSRGQSSKKAERRAQSRAAKAKVIGSPDGTQEPAEQEKAEKIYFMYEKVDKPKTLSGWAEMGKVHELFSTMEKREWHGEVYEHEVTKSAEEIKEILKGVNDLDVDVSRMKNPEKMVEKIKEAAREHVLEKAKEDPDWIINILGAKDRFGWRIIDGKSAAELVGIHKELFRDKGAAKKWYRDWSKIVHPDNNPGNPLAADVMDLIIRYYGDMK